MKKKNFLGKIIAFVACGLMLVSCAVNGTVSLKFKVLPQETYNACETEDEIKDRIIVTVSGKDYSLNELEALGAYVNGLDFSTSGKHTLTVSYMGNTISYDYEVVGDKVITGFNKSSEGIDLNNHDDSLVFGFNSVTGELGLYNKDTYMLEGTNTIASKDVYFVASTADDFDRKSTNSYLVVDEITLTDTLVFENPVDIIATQDSNAIKGDVEIFSEEEVNFKIDADIYGTLTIDCPNGHIEHYGQAERVEVLAASESTYVEHGVNAEAVIAAGVKNFEVASDAIIYNLDMTAADADCTITNNGTIYRYTGNHTITGTGFVFQDAIEASGEYSLPMANGKVTILNYKVTSATFDIGSKEQLVWFSNLSQSGKSPIIQDQPLVTVNITADIDMADVEWKPIANWNLWANGTACRWFGGDGSTYENGWEAYCNGDYSKNTKYTGSQFDFISTDEMYCRAFYNEEYRYNEKSKFNGAAIEPIYFVRLVINGNSKKITNLDNTFIGCLGYDSEINNLTVNYNVERGKDCTDENGVKNLIWNNLNGINVRGYLEGGCTCHIGLFCNNIYVPEVNGNVAGTVKFDAITLGGKFIYRNNYSEGFNNGLYLAGAFVSNVCAKGNNNGENCLIFKDIALDENLEFVITKRVNNKEYVAQWGSQSFEYDGNKHSNSCNYALFADYCCGSNGHDKSTFTAFNYSEDNLKLIGAQVFKKISNNQAGYYDFSGELAHNCVSTNANEYKIVWPATCERGKVIAPVCTACRSMLSGENYYVDNAALPHTYENAKFEMVTDSIKVGDIITIGVEKNNVTNDRRVMGTIYNTYIGSKTTSTKLPFSQVKDMLTLRVIKGAVNGSFGLVTNSGKLLIGSSDQIALKTQNSLTANSSWTISIDEETHKASIVSCGDQTYGQLGFNKVSNTYRFMAYLKTDILSEDNKVNIYRIVPEASTTATCTEKATISHYYCDCCNNYINPTDNSIISTIETGEVLGHTYEVQNWTLVKNADDLKAGDQIVIATKSGSTYYNISNLDDKTNSFTRRVFTYDETNELTTSFANYYTITLANNVRSEGKFALQLEDGRWLGSNTNANNGQFTYTTDYSLTSNKWSWSITIDNSSVATIVAQGSNGAKYIKCIGGTTNRFGPYNSSTTENSTPIYILKYNANDIMEENGVKYYHCDRCDKYFDINNAEVTLVHEYTLCTSFNDLTNGKKIIIASTIQNGEEINYIASSSSSTNNIFVNNNKISGFESEDSFINENSYVFELISSTNGNFYIINSNNKYIGSYDSSDGLAVSMGTGYKSKSDANTWTINVNDNGVASIYKITDTYTYVVSRVSKTVDETTTITIGRNRLAADADASLYANLMIFIQSTRLVPVV